MSAVAGVVRVGVDSGGTFTDLVAVDGGAVRVLKMPSQPTAPWRPVLEGARALAGALDGAAAELSHSTTVGTNALLERTGGKVALVTTRGFEDVLEIGRQARPRIYALHPERPPPLVEARLRFGLDERLAADGSVLRAPTEAALDELVERVRRAIRDDGVRAVAICFLHAYNHPAHEQTVAERLAPLGVPLSLSSQVLPLPREFERTSTTVADAYLRPVVEPYLAELAAAGRVRVMSSSGGVMSAASAAKSPARTVLSGPVAGVMGALAIARGEGIADAVTFDMGGTSTDVALIAAGQAALTDEATVAGCVLQLPMLAIHTVGAGGGSIAWRDPGGALKLGPQSAGADPGPAAYDRGGTSATVTDANLVLGRLSPDGLAGGAVRLSLSRARQALEPLGRALGRGVEETAGDILAVAATVMARAIKVVSVERGHDPAELALIAFGGAGPLHACDVARELGVRRVVVPPSPGLLCAYGALAADVVHDFVATVLRECGPSLAPAAIAPSFLPLVAAATAAFDADAVEPLARRLEHAATLRYLGQSSELTLPLRRADGSAPADLVAAFHAAHRARYGHALERPVELVTLRLRAVGRRAPLPALAEPREEGAPEIARTTLILDGKPQAAPVLARRRLPPGATIAGPALVCEYSSTTLLPGDARATVLPSGVLAITLD